MYDYRPQRQNYMAHLTVLWLFLCSAGCFIASGFVPKLPAILQAVGVLLLVPAIQLIARYMATQYLYRLRSYEDGKRDLEVYSYRGGDKMQLICRVGLEEITAAKPLSTENRRAPKGIKRYNYSPDMCPAKALVLSVTNEDGDCEVMLCPDQHMSEILQAVALPQSEEKKECP